MKMNNSLTPDIPDIVQPQAEVHVFTVLLVDDQMMVGEAVRRMLANHPDICFHHCNAAEQALQTAEHIHPTVILQDLVMPDIDGLSLVGQYRAHPELCHVPIIVFSTKEEPAVKSAAFKVGANDYLVKLPDPAELLARIRYHSKAYVNQLERDRMYQALHENQRQLIAANEKLQSLSETDDITGLRNRRYMNTCLANEWKRGCREQSVLTALMVEMDDFQRYADSFGIPAAENALKQIAASIRQNARRPADLATRYADGRFIVLLPNTSGDGAITMTDSLHLQIASLASRADFSADRKVTVSIGIASCTPALDHPADCLLDAAEKALDMAKQAAPEHRHFVQLDLGAPGKAG